MLHGRQRECAVVDELLAAARAGRGGALVLRGEAGIGKSALLDYAVGAAGDMRILRGTGIESESEFPFAVVHQLLRPILDEVDALPTRQGAALRAAFGLGPAAGEDRFLVSLAVLSLLAEAADGRPVLCIVDDAQWMDGASADALAFAARRLEADSIAMLFASRDDDATGLPELRLAGLDADAAGALLAERSATPLPAAVRDRLVAGTAGNPLALRELPSSLSADQLAGRVPLPDQLPMRADVEQVFLDRVRRMPSDTQTLLLIAAAEEGELDVILCAAVRLDVEADALDAAETAGLVRVEGDALEFCHPLMRSAVYRGATFRQRRAARLALAAVLDDDDDRRVWHLAAATLGPDEAVAGQLHRSADRARQRGGYAAAATGYERAAALTGTAAPRAERLADAADAAWLAGQPDRARTLLDEAARLGPEPAVAARVAHLRGSIEASCGVPDAAYAMLVAGAEQADPPRAARMLTEAGQVAWASGDRTRLADVSRCLSALPAADGAVTRAARLVQGLTSFLVGDTERAVPLLDGRGDGNELLSAAAALFRGDDATALDLFTRAVAGTRAAGAVATLPALLAPLSSLEAWTGRFAASSADANEGLRLAVETGQDNPAAHLRGVLAWLAAAQGREDHCRELAAAALSRGIGYRLGPQAAIASWALALLDLGAGRPAEARERLEALAAAGPGEGHPMLTVFAAADLVEAAARTDEERAARSALAGLEAWAAHTGALWAGALVARCRALLSPDAKAEEHFQDAVQRHAGGGRPFDAARTELRYGEWLRRQRRRTDARGHLRTALETFERLGARPWAELAAGELRASGETARRRDESAIGSLTPQELQIVRIVREGATNREIAAQLFLSPRTVDYHLHKVFTKLGISSRAELIRLEVNELSHR